MYLYWLSIFIVMHFIHEPLAAMIGATPSHVSTLINWLIDWLIDWLREFHFILLISLRLGSPGLISVLVSSGLPCNLTIPICVLVLYYILGKLNWTELNWTGRLAKIWNLGNAKLQMRNCKRVTANCKLRFVVCLMLKVSNPCIVSLWYVVKPPLRDP